MEQTNNFSYPILRAFSTKIGLPLKTIADEVEFAKSSNAPADAVYRVKMLNKTDGAVRWIWRTAEDLMLKADKSDQDFLVAVFALSSKLSKIAY